MEDELWKKIEDFPNYSISNYGRVRNDLTGKNMKINLKGGYCHISLKNGDIRKNLMVHRIVGKAFIPNPKNKSDINHIDKNRQNNHVSNLEWLSRTENNIHRCKNIILTTNKNKRISRLDKNTNDILESYNSIQEAGEWAFKNGLTKNSHNGRNAIGNCLKGLSGFAYGFSWKYDDNHDDLEGEIWKQVIIENVDSDKKYFVSNLGRFKNSAGIISENYKVNADGYNRVYIYNKTYLLHRLIAMSFLPNLENKEQVNHIDGNKTNNAVENLEWVTCSENNLHKFKMGLGNNYTRKIGQYDLEGNLVKEFPSIVAAAMELNTSKGNIRCVLMDCRKTAKGFVWKYLD